MTDPAPRPGPPAGSRRARLAALALLLVVGGASAGVAALLVTIFAHKQEARNPYLRTVILDQDTTDPEVWRKNWPREYDGYRRTVEASKTNFGGGDANPAQKANVDPWLSRAFAGYAFALDYRDRRGHAHMLADQENTRRVRERPQPGACLHCHASVIPTYRRLGAGDLQAGFVALSAMKYQDAHEELRRTGSTVPEWSGGAQVLRRVEGAHPVSCVDCHAPDTMELRVERPGFIQGIRALAASSEPTPHLPSIERWRAGPRDQPYDPNRDASRQELRSFVCGQCHVEYYCGPKTTLFFPWGRGLRVEQIEALYDDYRFPDGHRFYDWQHAETGAEVLKAQHPEFETWSQGIHARAGVSCADCHMPYRREGAIKVSEHYVRSPLLDVARACQTCHHASEAEIRSRVDIIQQRNYALMQRAAAALIGMLDALKQARAAGLPAEQLAPLHALHRKAQWRLDFVAAENSMGFHAPQETARILAEALDYARQAELGVTRRAPQGSPAVAPPPSAPVPAADPVSPR